ncbi:unnamed protein product [Vicia faba]|uniref:Uncharacterized protein n=1 Tax=Vicia faba TaxID=3906 RepID=A0AAV1ADV2_VICFA|nr:unnamed protein product [Vicia faba]
MLPWNIGHYMLTIVSNQRRWIFTIEMDKTIGRGLMWNMTHKKKDGSYVNEKAKEIGEKIDSQLNQKFKASSEFLQMMLLERYLEKIVGYISTKEGGTLPADLPVVLANHTQQTSEVESEPSSSYVIRSSDASNTHDTNPQSPSNDT